MAVVAYQGQVTYGAFAVAASNPENVAPADRPTYDATTFSTQPGAAARANGYPRVDGQAGRAGAR